MMHAFAARAALTVSRATLGLALGTTAISVALAQETTSDDDQLKLPELVIGANRQQLQETLSPGVVSVVYPDDVKGEHKSLPDLLDQIPGVYVRRVSGTGQYTTVSIRGSAPSQVNIYIDGVPVNLSSELAADLSVIPMSNVERVEVYRGTTPARFSGAPLGGAINIVTKRPKDVGGSLSYGMRSFEGRQASGSLNFPVLDGAMMVGLDTERSKGDFTYKNIAVSNLNKFVYPDGTTVRNNPYDSQSANYGTDTVKRTRLNNSYDKDNLLLKWQNDHITAKWAYNYVDRYMPANLANNDSGYSFHTQDLPDAPLGTRERRRQKLGQHEGVLGWNDAIGDLTLGLNLNFMDKNDRYRNEDSTAFTGIGRHWTEYQTRRYGIAGDTTYSFDDGLLFDHLAELHGEVYRETMHADADGIGNSDYLREFRRYMTRIQGQDTLTIPWLDGLQVTPLGRLERLQGPVIGSRWIPSGEGPGGEYAWKPTGSISAKKKIGEGWSAFGNWGTYNRYPNFYEIYGNGIGIWPAADSDGTVKPLQREFGHTWDAGFGWDGNLASEVQAGFRATYFERKTKNEISLYSVPIGAKYINGGQAFTHGGELEGYVAYGKKADFQFALTRQEGWYRTPDSYYVFGGTSAGDLQSIRDAGNPLRTLRSPAVAANMRLNLHWLNGDLTTFGELKHTGRMFTNIYTFERSLTTIDAGLHYKVADGVKVSAGVIDMFNQGPKQSVYSSQGGKVYQYNTCTWNGVEYPGDDDDCNAFGDPVSHQQLIPFSTGNVQNPQQGRTLYATLAWTF